ncbi:unnamed protein product, partial [Effrenium voratum]
ELTQFKVLDEDAEYSESEDEEMVQGELAASDDDISASDKEDDDGDSAVQHLCPAKAMLPVSRN